MLYYASRGGVYIGRQASGPPVTYTLARRRKPGYFASNGGVLVPQRLSSAGGDIGTGRADEADTAYALLLKKLMATGRADETDTAYSLALRKALTTVRADEANTAYALALRKMMATGRADETDTAYDLALVAAGGDIVVGRADEADTALALAFIKIMAAGRADEADTALALTLAIPGAVMTTAFKVVQDALVAALLAAPTIVGARVVGGRSRPMPTEHASDIAISVEAISGQDIAFTGGPQLWEVVYGVEIRARGSASVSAFDAIDPLLAAVYVRLRATTPPAGVLGWVVQPRIRLDVEEASTPIGTLQLALNVQMRTLSDSLELAG